eukprot:1255821-Amphidinium_carterae.1
MLVTALDDLPRNIQPMVMVTALLKNSTGPCRLRCLVKTKASSHRPRISEKTSKVGSRKLEGEPCHSLEVLLLQDSCPTRIAGRWWICERMLPIQQLLIFALEIETTLQFPGLFKLHACSSVWKSTSTPEQTAIEQYLLKSVLSSTTREVLVAFLVQDARKFNDCDADGTANCFTRDVVYEAPSPHGM